MQHHPRSVIVVRIGKLEFTGKVFPRWSDADDRPLGIDFLELVEPAGAASGTHAAGLRPGLGRAEIRFPEGPSSALARAGSIHAALSRFAVEEHTISVSILLQTLSHANFTDIPRFKLRNLHSHLSCKGCDVLFVHPHVSRRAGTAIATGAALETQAVFVPRLRLRVRHDN
jgi:hypothetical protein